MLFHIVSVVVPKTPSKEQKKSSVVLSTSWMRLKRRSTQRAVTVKRGAANQLPSEAEPAPRASSQLQLKFRGVFSLRAPYKLSAICLGVDCPVSLVFRVWCHMNTSSTFDPEENRNTARTARPECGIYVENTINITSVLQAESLSILSDKGMRTLSTGNPSSASNESTERHGHVQGALCRASSD